MQNKLWTLFSLFTYFHRRKNPLHIFSGNETSTNLGLSEKWSGIMWTKSRGYLYLPCSCCDPTLILCRDSFPTCHVAHSLQPPIWKSRSLWKFLASTNPSGWQLVWERGRRHNLSFQVTPTVQDSCPFCAERKINTKRPKNSQRGPVGPKVHSACFKNPISKTLYTHTHTFFFFCRELLWDYLSQTDDICWGVRSQIFLKTL